MAAATVAVVATFFTELKTFSINDFVPSLVFRFYISALLPLNLDDHNRIPSSILRLMRRTVRDLEGRGSSVEKTMSMWDSV